MVAATILTPREPSRPGPNELVNSVHDVMRVVVRHLQPALAEEGISSGQFWTLHLVSSLRSASLSTVARHLSLSAPTVCANMDQLVSAGLVTRHRSDRDRRAVELSLTAKGRKVESRVWARIGEFMDIAARGLPPEDIATTVRVFRELQRRLEPVGEASGGHP